MSFMLGVKNKLIVVIIIVLNVVKVSVVIPATIVVHHDASLSKGQLVT